MLVNGQWSTKWHPFQKSGKNGEFIRQTSSFRHWVTKDGAAGKTGDSGFKAEPERYHLYLAYICPWASRVLMALHLKGLEKIISVSIVDPVLTDYGWQFNINSNGISGSTPDHLHGYHHIYQLYIKADPTCTGRATIPLLWDKKNNTIVNNESADILEMLNSAFNEWAEQSIDLRPSNYITEMETLNAQIYDNINNAVYRAGFAQNQAVYEQATTDLFDCMNQMERKLTNNRFLMGEQFTESDIRLFVTLIRFDLAYYSLFKCNLKNIANYPVLSRYIKEVYHYKNISETVKPDHIKQGYYSVKALNPQGIVPVGPTIEWMK